jgi:CRISPR-associated protein Cmr5
MSKHNKHPKPAAKTDSKAGASVAAVSVKPAAMSRGQSIEQERAQHAMKQVAEVLNSSDSVKKKFKAYANSLPAMIQSTGLGQALAFAKVKANGTGDEAAAWKAMYEALDNWLQGRKIWAAKGDSKVDTLAALVAGNQPQYQLAQAEAFAYLVWLKQFARAMIAGEADTQ